MLVIGGLSERDIEAPVLSVTSDGWDQVRELRWMNPASLGLIRGDARAPTGISGNFFVQDWELGDCRAGWREVSITSLGIHGVRGYIADPIAASSEVKNNATLGFPGAPVGVPVPGTAEIPRPGVRVRWLSTVKPDSSQVGGGHVPPETFGVPAYPLTMSDDLKQYNYPAGWYLADRAGVNLPETTYYKVTDVYYYQYNPTLNG